MNSDGNKSTGINYKECEIFPVLALNLQSAKYSQQGVSWLEINIISIPSLLLVLRDCLSRGWFLFINNNKQSNKRCSVLGKTTHITVLVSMLVNKGTVLARPTCTAGRLGHINHVDISCTTRFWRWSWKENLCLAWVKKLQNQSLDHRKSNNRSC